jgi:hypothetical protein
VLFKGLITVLAVNALLVIISIPLILRKVRRNVVYGFRTSATLSDDFVWYEANAYFGRRLVALSTVAAVAVLILYSGRTVSERFFFPAVWVGPILLLDPLLERAGRQSLSLAVAGGTRHRVWSLLTGGPVCGLMWEFWNFWAFSKWIYTVPSSKKPRDLKYSIALSRSLTTAPTWSNLQLFSIVASFSEEMIT